MASEELGFSLEMPKVGIIKGVLAKDIEVVGKKVVNLRTCARPYRNMYSAAQLRTIKQVIEKYGSGKVHLSPRHNLEIPEVRQKYVDAALRELYIAGLFPGGAGTSVRNIFTCPDWCAKQLRPVQEIGTMVSQNFGDHDMPNKVTVSFAGCFNACSRPQNCDIGIMAVARVATSGASCDADCPKECLASCRFEALELHNGKPLINQRCVFCGRCAQSCPQGVIYISQSGYKVLVGGKEGSTVRFGQEMALFIEDFQVLELIESVLRHYRQKAALRPGSERKHERLGEVVARLGLQAFMA